MPRSMPSWASSRIVTSATLTGGHQNARRAGAHGASGLKGGLHVEVDVDLVAEQQLAAVERDVEVDAPLLAADAGGGLETGDGLAVRVLLDTEQLDVQLDRLGDVLDGQVAGDDPRVAVLPDTGAGEGHLRALLHVEEVAGAQVVVPLLVAGVDGGQLDRRGGAALEDVVGGDDLALELGEGAADLGHQVPHGEADHGVSRVDHPGACGQAGSAAGDGGAGGDAAAHCASSRNCSGWERGGFDLVKLSIDAPTVEGNDLKVNYIPSTLSG